MRYELYAATRRLLPPWMSQGLGRSRVLKPLRNWLIRPKGGDDVRSGPIAFHGIRLNFTANYRAFDKASRTGIEPRLSRTILAHVPEGGVCLDVGANYGFLSLMMAAAVGPRGRVLSFECDPAVFDCLERTLRDNRVDGWCRAVRGAVGDGRDGSTQALDAMEDVRALDRFDLLKVDVDGGDFEVLQGAEQLLRRFHPLVLVEITQDQEAIVGFLRDVGYSHLLDMDGRPVDPARWPENLIAACRPIEIPMTAPSQQCTLSELANGPGPS